MSAHDVLEEMRETKRALGAAFYGAFVEAQWQRVESLLPAAVSFQFGGAVPSWEHTDFGFDLLEKGMFRLPFPIVVYDATNMHNGALIAVQIDDGRIDMVVSSRGLIHRHQLVPSTIYEVTHDEMRMQTITTGRLQGGRNGGPFTDEDYKDLGYNSKNWLLGLTVMMMAKDASIQSKPASEKVNARRVAKGKPPIGERRVVTIRSATGNRIDAPASGRHVSMHWRRGHFRTIPSGRVVPVAPSIVGAREDAHIPKPKSYKLDA